MSTAAEREASGLARALVTARADGLRDYELALLDELRADPDLAAAVIEELTGISILGFVRTVRAAVAGMRVAGFPFGDLPVENLVPSQARAALQRTFELATLEEA
jgi:hypothetical protein